MAGLIPQEFIDSLLSQVDIVQVVDSHISLKKTGINYSAICPFHNEKSPSFTVSPSKQFYHCFGCGAHGDAIAFEMEYTGVSFADAVTNLASSVGMAVPTDEKAEQAIQLTVGMRDAIRKAADLYKQELRNSQDAILYLKERGMTGVTAAKYEIGYSPDAWQNLKSINDAYTSKDYIDSGLLVTSENGSVYDRFRGRIMFPIHNSKGDVVAFGARILKGEATKESPKYLNSPETALFQKGSELYGLYQAKKSIKDTERALVVEGYMDVVMLSQHGVDNVVATLGTATTDIHIAKLSKLAKEIVFCFDGDNAGRAAAWRALKNTLPVLTDDITVKFLFLPEGYDPDTFLLQHGKNGFDTLVAGSVTFSEYFISQLKSNNPLASSEDKLKLINEAEPLLGSIRNQKVSMVLRSDVAKAAGLDAQVFTDVMQNSMSKKQKNDAPVIVHNFNENKVRTLAAMAVCKPSLANAFNHEVIDASTENKEEILLVMDICKKLPPDTRCIVAMKHLEGAVPADFIKQLEVDVSEQGEIDGIELEFNRLQEKILIAKKELLNKTVVGALYTKPFDEMTPEELQALNESSKPIRRKRA